MARKIAGEGRMDLLIKAAKIRTLMASLDAALGDERYDRAELLIGSMTRVIKDIRRNEIRL